MIWRLISRPLLSWALYDFANTIFSAVVLTAFFPLYFTRLAGSNTLLGLATTGSMLLAALIIPFLGALSDQTGKTKAYLFRTTLLCIAALCGLSFSQSVPVLFVLFTLACFFFHSSLVFYNSLLPMVASPEKQGFASGLGTGLGYLGVVIALPIAQAVSARFGQASVFAAAGMMFFLSAQPLFYFVPERTVANPIPFTFRLWKAEWQKLLLLWEDIKSKPDLMLFFSGNFLVVDALNTMILWFSVYAREAFHPDQGQLIALLMGVNFSAFVMGIFTGWLTDRWGAMKTLILATGALALTVLGLTLAPSFQSFIAVTTVGGAFSIAGIWTSGRKALLDFAPEEKIGEYFGIYGLITKISIIGNLVFSIVADLAGFKAALRVLLFPSLCGGLLLFLSLLATPRAKR